MNVLYIHQYFSTPQGPGGIRSYEFAKKLLARGHQVTMVCAAHRMSKTGLTEPYANNMREGMVDGIHVIEVQVLCSNSDGLIKRIISFIRFSWRASLLALRLKYDLIFTTSTPLTVAIPGILAKIFCAKPFIFEVRDLWPELPAAMGVIRNPVILFGMRCLERLAYRCANFGIGLSPGICKGMKHFGTLKDDTVALIPNGCDVAFFDQVSEGVAEQLPVALLDVFKENFVAVFAGAHGQANGLDAVLDAAVVLKKENASKVKLVFIGDGKLKPNLQARVKQEDLSDYCLFFDPIPKAQLPFVLKQAKVGLMVLKNIPAFYYGTSPNKFFDYLSTGLPVLNNYPGWVADLITEHQCGMVVPSEDPIAFAQALIDLSKISDSELAAMGARGKKLALAQFNRENLAGEFSLVCERVISSVLGD